MKFKAKSKNPESQHKFKKQFGGSTYVEKPLMRPVMGSRIKDDKGNKIFRNGQGKELATGEAEPVYPEALLLPGTPIIKGLGKIGNAVVDAVNPIGGMGKTPGRVFKGAVKTPTTTAVVEELTPEAKNLEDLKYAKDFYSKYKYPIPDNIEEIAKSGELTDQTIQKLANQHNTFTRGVSTNWKELEERNPEILQHLADKGIDYRTNPEGAAKYMATHVPIQTGYGRAGLNQSLFQRGKDAIYTSNSRETAEGYTYGDGYIVDVKRPTDFSSPNRRDWIDKNTPQYYDDYLPTVLDGDMWEGALNTEKALIKSNADIAKRKIKDVKLFEKYKKDPERYLEYRPNETVLNGNGEYQTGIYRFNDSSLPRYIPESIRNGFKKIVQEDGGQYYRSKEEALSNIDYRLRTHSQQLPELKQQIADLNNIEEIASINRSKRYLSDFDKNMLRTEKQEVNPDFKLDEISDFPELSSRIGTSGLKDIPQIREDWQKIAVKMKAEGANNDEIFKEIKKQLEPHINNKYAHYIHLGTPGEKILEPIGIERITPDKYKNRSRAHTGRYTEGMSAAAIAAGATFGQEDKKQFGGNMRKFKRQFGGGGMEVIVEDGELYKDLDGVIQEVTGYDHHDNILQNGKDISITNKNNGGELVEAQTVLSDSYSKVQSGDRKNTAKEKKLKFTKKDAKKLIDQKWFSPRKDMSPSEVVREAEKQKLKHLNKYDDVVQNDKISQNSKALNIIQNPTKEEIYDLVFEEQEKRMGRIDNPDVDVEDMQYGGRPMASESTATQRAVRNPNFEVIPDDLLVGSSTATPAIQKAYTAKNYPNIQLRYPNPKDPNTYKHPNGRVRASFNSRERTAYLPKENDGDGLDLAAELAHAQQLDSLGVERMEQATLQERNAYGENTYEVPGTIEYDAHKNREEPIQRDFSNYATTARKGALRRTDGQLAAVLGRKSVHPGIKDWFLNGDKEVGLIASTPAIKTKKFTTPQEDPFVNQFKETLKQYGGVPTSLDGLNEYPNQPVMVPAGDITMEGIDYPVDAYDGNTGEYLDTMQPDMNYKFNTNKVLEVPKAQFGTRDRSAHYRKLLEQAQSDLAKYDAQLKNASSPSERKLAQLYREKAQNSVNYLSNNPNLKGQVEVDPNGEVWNPLAQQESNFPLLNSGVESTVNMPTYTGPDRGIRRGMPASATPPINGTRTPASVSTRSTDPLDIEKYIPEPYIIKRGDSLSKIANAYGLTVEDLLKMNPEISNRDKITEGDRLNIPELRIKGKRPDLGEGTVDRMSEISGMQELPNQAPEAKEGEIPTLDIKAEDVAAIGQKAKDVLDKVKLGKIDRTQGTLAIKEMIAANRNINLPYKAVAPNRTIGYQEEDVTPYLDEIDSSVAQQLQYVNQNTSQGQAILSNIMGNASRAKRQTLNRANAQNLQRRQYTDNANVQLQNQQDLMQEQFNKSYVDETYQTIAAYDRNRVQQADYVDQMTNNNTRLNNTFLMENIKNPNFQIDPITGEVFRIGKQWDAPKAKYGLKKRKS